MQDLLDLLAGDIKTLEEQTRGTWSDFLRLMSLGGIDPKPTSDDFGMLKDSRARFREMIEKVLSKMMNSMVNEIVTAI